VGTFADITVDATSLRNPAIGKGSLNGDAYDDLVFWRPVPFGVPLGKNQIKVIYGGPSFPATLAANATTIVIDDDETGVLGVTNFNAFATHLLNWDGDSSADLLVVTTNRAYVISGKSLIPDANGNVFKDGSSSSATPGISATIIGSSGVPFSATPTVVGDVNGDGLDDVLFVDTDSIAQPKAYLLVGRASAAPELLTLATADATFVVGSFNVPESSDEIIGKMRVSVVGDLNRDGYDDIALSRSLELDAPGSASVYLFLGSASFSRSSGRALTAADAAARFARQVGTE
jgi:hypothetical protein